MGKFKFRFYLSNLLIIFKKTISKIKEKFYNSCLSPEFSDYTKKLKNLDEKNFTNIRQISVDYINNLDTNKKNELHKRLKEGTEIIKDIELLYQYFFSYGKMHYNKVYEGLNKIIQEIEDKKIILYDWGCGQALASMVFFEFIKENTVKTEVDSLILIEPSELALRRGIAHINCIYPQINSIKPICKDLDSIEVNDIIINNDLIKLHLFSNILDIPTFDLEQLCNKLTKLKGQNIFFCVSPYMKNDKNDSNRNDRLDYFKNFFNNNFKETYNIISEITNTKTKDKWKSNYCCLNNNRHKDETYCCGNAWTRHELIFCTYI